MITNKNQFTHDNTMSRLMITPRQDIEHQKYNVIQNGHVFTLLYYPVIGRDILIPPFLAILTQN